jgi:exodeoxyribonuclease-3
VRFICAYVVNGQAVGSDKYAYKMAWLAALRDWVGEEMARIRSSRSWATTTSRRKTATSTTRVEWAGQIHCSDLEREALRALCGLGLADAFRMFEQPEKQYSWWDYRQMAFRRNRGLRIDHILLSPALAQALQRLHHRPRTAQVGAAVGSHVP